MSNVDHDSSNQPRRNSLWRVFLLIGLVVALWVVGYATGLAENFSVENLRAAVQGAPLVGIAVYCGLFCVGQIAQISGHPFIAAAVFVWGWWKGALVALLGATIGAVASFALARAIGGDLRGLDRPRIQRVLAKLDRAPWRTMVVARAIFMTAPPLATAFALSGVRHRDHFSATVVGLIPPMLLSAFVWEFGLGWLGLQAN